MNRRLLIALPGLFLAGPVLAHTGHAEGGGLLTGLFHPLAGTDHLLAMVAVGLWAARMGGRALWALPLTFVGVMMAGAGLAMAGLVLPMIEPGIAASVLLLGLAVAMGAGASLGVAVAAVGTFALWHGAAHGYEIPVTAAPVLYAAGFAAATAMLHAAGLGLGVTLRTAWLRVAGGAIALAGAVQLLAA